jgi:hypothetical protein
LEKANKYCAGILVSANIGVAIALLIPLLRAPKSPALQDWKLALSSPVLLQRRNTHETRPLNSFPCGVVRFTSQNCPYCSSARSKEWLAFRESALTSGCPVFHLSPGGTDAAATAVEKHDDYLIEAIPFAWVSEMNLTATPTSLLFVSGAGAVWVKEGVITRPDRDLAVRTLSAVRYKRP